MSKVVYMSENDKILWAEFRKVHPPKAAFGREPQKPQLENVDVEQLPTTPTTQTTSQLPTAAKEIPISMNAETQAYIKERLAGMMPQSSTPQYNPPKKKGLFARMFSKKEKQQPNIIINERIPNYQLPVLEEGKATFQKQEAGIGWKQKMTLRRNPTSTYLITMFFGNGTCEHFVLKTTSLFFRHGKNKDTYHLNKTQGIYDVNEKQHRFFYHEDFAEPLQFKTIVKEGGNEAYAFITPENLEPYINMEYVKVLAKLPEITKWLKILIFLSIAILCLLVIIVIVFIAQSGIFQQLGAQLQGVTGVRPGG